MADKKWYEKEAEELKAEQKTAQENDYKPFLRLEAGENVIEIDTSIEPKDFTSTKYPNSKPKKMFRVKSNNEVYDFLVTRSSPLYRQLIEGINAGKKKFTIIRVGSDMDTKYELKKAQ